LFEEKLLQMAASLDRTLILVQGKPGNPEVHFHQNLCVINSLPSLDLYRLLVRARLVISRPGYSSLMDYATIGRGQLLLVPTPGQVEQEYLGERIELKGLAYSVSQNSLHLETDIQKAVAYAGFPPTAGNERKLLESAVDAVFGIKPP
jgi:UDP-N-acetylglucosamine:LPS N-acetylglucosamine transferase